MNINQINEFLRFIEKTKNKKIFYPTYNGTENICISFYRHYRQISQTSDKVPPKIL
jgi:hypothetical protein